MKLKKKSAIMVFLLFLALPMLYAQEKGSKDITEKHPDENTAVKIHDKETDKTQDTVKKTDTYKETDSAKKKKSSPESSKSQNQKINEKEVPDNFNLEKNEGDLLLINEGSFKYKRIPDIKIIEKKVVPEDIPSGSGSANNISDPSKNNGFFGLGKTTSDIIVKGGVLLLILLIFILYKSRMSAPGGKKSSKSRKVLNSFRK